MQSPAILLRQYGGPEVLTAGLIEVGDPGPGELRVRHIAIGLNFADIYQRSGRPGPHAEAQFPIVLGTQGAGVVEAVGGAATGFAVGDLVSYLHPGAYSAVRLVPAARTIALPKEVPPDVAAGWLLRGMTAEYLLRRLFPVKAGDAVLIHAAVGGMGTILTQWAHALGAQVIGTVGSASKIQLAADQGCDVVINYSEDDFVARTLDATQGRGVDVVYDAVGKAVFLPSLECLRPMGMAINYGTASGAVGAFDIQLLHQKSLIVSRPTLRTYTATTDDLRRSAAAFFDIVTSGSVILPPCRRYPFEKAREAHADLEGRVTTGASILLPPDPGGQARGL